MLSRVSDLQDNFEIDPETHYIKAFRSDGEFYLIEPRAAMELGIWARQRGMDLIEAQKILDQAQGNTN